MDASLRDRDTAHGAPPCSRGRTRLGTADRGAICTRPGLTRFQLRSDGECYRCMRCRSDDVSDARRRRKARLVDAAGGCCAVCGYDAYAGALQFHHLDPATKEFSVSQRGVTLSFERALAEARKCVLLCANCHAEVEGGHRSLVA